MDNIESNINDIEKLVNCASDFMRKYDEVKEIENELTNQNIRRIAVPYIRAHKTKGKDNNE